LHVTEIIENSKKRTIAHISKETTDILGDRTTHNFIVLGSKCVVYGKNILTALSAKLMGKYGKYEKVC
jgi:hypothetical protein